MTLWYLNILEAVSCPSCTEGDAEMMQPEEGAEDHPAAASREGLTSETDAASEVVG